jgi:replicative DNA helicase
MDDARVPPSDVMAEEAVLGSLIINPDSIHEIATFLQPKDFYRDGNQKIYEVIIELIEKNKGIDVITISHELRKRKYLEDIGGETYVIGLLNAPETSMNIQTYARGVKDFAIKREMVHAASSIANLGFGDEDSELALDQAEQVIFGIRGNLNKGTSDGSIKEWAKIYMDEIEFMAQNEGEMSGLPTGFIDIDRMLGGLQRADYIVVGARPSMGKTALLLQIAMNNIKMGKKVGIFSLEMSANKLVERLISSNARIDSQRLRRADLEASEWNKFYKEIGELSEKGLFICDDMGLSVTQIKAKSRRWHARHGLDMVMIDYLQLIDEPNQQNRNLELGAISRGIKGIGRELDIPTVVASQLSRATEQRGNKRPQLSDLRDSGTIEQDADIVAFLYRDEYYHPESSDRPNIAEVNIAKNRNGPTFVADLYWHGQLAAFRNLQRSGIEIPSASQNGSTKKEPAPIKSLVKTPVAQDPVEDWTDTYDR